MSSIDAVWYHLEEPTNLMVITAVLWFDERVERERLKAVLQHRLVEAYPRFRQRVVPSRFPLVPPSWEEDPAFDLDAHLQSVTLPAPGDQGALEQLTSEVASTPLDPSRPPWRFYLVEGCAQGSALLARLHHCIADGMALASILLSLADGPPPEAISVGPASGKSRWLLKGAQVALALVRLLAMAADPRTFLTRPLGTAKRVAWSAPISLDKVKALGRAIQGTVNDVLLAAVTGALRRSLREHGNPVRDLRALVPVNLRPLDEERPMGNRFGLVFLPLPLEAGERDARLWELKRRMGHIKRSLEAAVSHGLLRLLGLLPIWLERALATYFGRKASLVMTNVPGPRHPVHLAGIRLGGVIFWVPQPARLGLGVSIFSYAGQVTLGIASDAGVLPEPRQLVQAFEEELAGLAPRGAQE